MVLSGNLSWKTRVINPENCFGVDSGASEFIPIDCEPYISDDPSSEDLLDLSGANLSDATASKAKLDTIDLRNPKFANSFSNDLIVENSYLGWSDMTGIQLHNARITNSSFALSDFAGAHITGTVFLNSDLVQVDFTGSVLKGVKFLNTQLQESEFSNMNLSALNFEGATVLNLGCSDSGWCPRGFYAEDTIFKGAWYFSDRPPTGLPDEVFKNLIVCPESVSNEYLNTIFAALWSKFT